MIVCSPKIAPLAGPVISTVGGSVSANVAAARRLASSSQPANAASKIKALYLISFCTIPSFFFFPRVQYRQMCSGFNSYARIPKKDSPAGRNPISCLRGDNSL